MARVFLVPIDLAQNELQNAVVQNVASFPASPLAGQISFRTSDNILYWYDGTTWVPAQGSGGGGSVNSVTAGDSTITIGGTSTDPTVAVTAGGLDHTYISDFDTQVRTSRLDQMAAPTASVSFNGQSITNVADPTNPQDAATKNYVDAIAQGLSPKPTAWVATTAALSNSPTYSNGSSGVGATLTASSNGVLTVDGVSTTAGMIILVKDQAAAEQNGLYVVTTAGSAGVSYVLTRHVDMDTASEFSGAFVPVGNAGTTNANTLWLANPSVPVTVGTTAIPFTQLNSQTSYVAGNGINISGNTISAVVVSGGNLTLGAGGLDVDTTKVVRKFAANIGNGSSSSITVTHNLGTLDITASIRDASTGAFVDCDIIAATTNTATFGFTSAPTTNAYRVVIHG